MPRRPRAAAAAAVAAASLTIAGLTAAATTGSPDRLSAALAWRSAIGPRAALDTGQRVIVVLAAPSLADRATARGTLPAPRTQRRLARETDALQRRLLGALRKQGIRLRREHVYTLTLNGFSTTVDARALTALERTPGIAGVYPVRAVYPAELGTESAGPAGEAPLSLPGTNGRGVTVALLDTGVDRTHPALAGRVAFGVDLVDGDADTSPARQPGGDRVETHGTRMAALVVGGAEGGVSGVAPGARVLPIRVLGWQRAPDGTMVEAGRGDVLLAGLERAVDPDGDGDVEDAAQIALAALVEPFASFPDSPESRAVTGAARLGTLVVAAAGNDGPGGAGGSGTVGSPAGAAAALAVGAADTRTVTEQAHVVVTAGAEVLYAADVAVLGGLVPADGLTVGAASLRGASLARPGADPGATGAGLEAGDLFAPDGRSRVVGSAVLVPADGEPLIARVEHAQAAGARAVVVYGSLLPAGALGAAQGSAIPTVSLPGFAGLAVERALASGGPVSVAIGPAPPLANAGSFRVAGFSSSGPAFDGRPKPDLVAPGVGLRTADPGQDAGSAPGYATVSGTSAAAAVAAGAAALVAAARPELSADELRSVLIGSAQPLVGTVAEPVATAGSGLIDPVGADAAELAVEPATIVLGHSDAGGWVATVPVRVRNVSIRPLRVRLGVATDPSPYALTFAAEPTERTLQPGQSATLRLLVGVKAREAVPATLSGVLVVSTPNGPSARVPWAGTTGVAGTAAPPLTEVRLITSGARPSAGAPAALSFQAGSVRTDRSGTVIQPVGRLDVELWRGATRFGVLLRLRDLLPGAYVIGITGRGPDGARLAPGRYRLLLRAEQAASSEGHAGRAVVSVPFVIAGPPRA